VAVIVNSVNSDFFTYAPLLWKLSRQVDNRIEPVLFINGNDPGGFLQEILKSWAYNLGLFVVGNGSWQLASD